jgi:hypothetical protein
MCACDFCTNFNIGRSDIIYGLKDPRYNALLHLQKSRQDVDDAVKAGYWHQINFYNDSTVNADEQGAVADIIVKGATSKVAEEQKSARFAKAILASKYNPYDLPPQAVTTHPAPAPKVIPERKTLRGTVIPEKVIIKPSPVSTAKEGIFEQMRDLMRYRRIRRGCKFGLVYTAEAIAPTARIHFILDGLPLERVIDKTPVKARRDGAPEAWDFVPITYSELRAVFRHWDALKSRVIFYRLHPASASASATPATPGGFAAQPAPWESDPGAWAVYAAKRLKKYRDAVGARLSSPSGASTHAPSGALVRALDQAAALESSGQANRAARLLREALNPTGHCSVCGVAADTRCARCHRAYYCSREHQKMDWPMHKPVCFA